MTPQEVEQLTTNAADIAKMVEMIAEVNENVNSVFILCFFIAFITTCFHIHIHSLKKKDKPY